MRLARRRWVKFFVRGSLRIAFVIAAATAATAIWVKSSSFSDAQEQRLRQPATTSAHGGLPQVVARKTYKLTPSEFSAYPAALFYRDAPTAVAWSADGGHLAAISDAGKHIEVWDTAGGTTKVLTSGGFGPSVSSSLEFLIGNELLTPPKMQKSLEEDNLSFSIWDIQNGSLVKSVEGPFPDKPWRNNFFHVYTISPDKRLVAASPLEPTAKLITLYSTQSWQVLHNLPVDAPSGALAFSPDGNQVACGDIRHFYQIDGIYTEAVVDLFDTATGTLVKTIAAYEKGLSVSISAIAYSPDARFIATGVTLFSKQHISRSVRVFQVSNGAEVASYPVELHPIRKLQWSPSGKYIAFVSGGDETVRLWDPDVPNDLGTIIHFDIDPLCLAMSPNGTQLASCDSSGITVFTLSF
jgi:WD40 repeat protein